NVSTLLLITLARILTRFRLRIHSQCHINQIVIVVDENLLDRLRRDLFGSGIIGLNLITWLDRIDRLLSIWSCYRSIRTKRKTASSSCLLKDALCFIGKSTRKAFPSLAEESGCPFGGNAHHTADNGGSQNAFSKRFMLDQITDHLACRSRSST